MPFFKRSPKPAPPKPRPTLHLPMEDDVYHDLEDWLEYGRHIISASRQNHLLLSFAIGDWYNEGEFQWGERAQTAAQALPQISWSVIRQCAYVAKRIPDQLRLPQLSWHVYRQLAPLDEDVRSSWLKELKSGDIEEEDLKHHLKQLSAERRSTRSKQPRSRVRAGGRSAECHPAEDLGPTAVAGPCAPDGPRQEEPGNLRQCLTPAPLLPFSPSPLPPVHELAAWIRSNYSQEERLKLIKLLLAQAPQEVKDQLAQELVENTERPCMMRMSRERWADWEFLSDQVGMDISIVANRLMYHADRVYGPYIRRRRLSLRDAPAP